MEEWIEIKIGDGEWQSVKNLCTPGTPLGFVQTWYAVPVPKEQTFDLRMTLVDRDGVDNISVDYSLWLFFVQRSERPVSHEGGPVDASPLVLYPNPARSRAHVQGLELGDSWSIQDALGRELAAGAGAELPADRLSSGTYVVRVTRRDGRVQTKRLTVTR